MGFGMRPDERTLFHEEFEKESKKQRGITREERREWIRKSAKRAALPFGKRVKEGFMDFETGVTKTRKRLKRISKQVPFKLKGVGVHDPFLAPRMGRKGREMF